MVINEMLAKDNLVQDPRVLQPLEDTIPLSLLTIQHNVSLSEHPQLLSGVSLLSNVVVRLEGVTLVEEKGMQVLSRIVTLQFVLEGLYALVASFVFLLQ